MTLLRLPFASALLISSSLFHSLVRFWYALRYSMNAFIGRFILPVFDPATSRRRSSGDRFTYAPMSVSVISVIPFTSSLRGFPSAMEDCSAYASPPALFLFFGLCGLLSTRAGRVRVVDVVGLIIARPLRVVIPSACTDVGGDVPGVLYALCEVCSSPYISIMGLDRVRFIAPGDPTVEEFTSGS